MKRIVAILIFVIVAMLILAPTVLAQEDAPLELPETAVGGVNWLLAHIDVTTAWLLGLISMVVTSVVNKFIPDKGTREAILSSVRFAVAAIVPAALTWLYTALLPVAEKLDSSGVWAIFLAIFGMATVNYLGKTRVLDPLKDILESWSAVLAKA